MMYLTDGEKYAIIEGGKMTHMGTLKPFTNDNTVVGLTGEELFKLLYDNGYRHITDEAELAKLMLILD